MVKTAESALVTDIRRGSLEDGPGMRTVVFFKGCPLSCRWCHNPECISFEKETLFYPEKCIGCGKCAEGCYAGARVVCGREMTAEQVLKKILADRPYYGTEGGVTFSGGEPLAQAPFLRVLLPMLKEAGIPAAAETTMFLWEEDVLSALSFVLCDIKTMDNEKHQRYTGVSNRTILANIRRLDTLGIPFCIHTPLIPGVNDTREDITAIRDFAKALTHVTGYSLLPYSPLGIPKRRALGMEVWDFPVPDKETVKELSHYADLS